MGNMAEYYPAKVTARAPLV